MRREQPDRPPERPQPAEAGAGPSAAASAGVGAGAGPDERDHLDQLRRDRQARVAKALVGLFVLVVLILFVTTNAHPVKVNFVFDTRYPQLIWVMVACAILGGVLGYLLGRPGKQVRLRHRGSAPERGTDGPSTTKG